MALVRWEPIREISSIQNEVNRLFDAFFDPAASRGEGGGRRWVPAMDLTETDDHFVLRADLPGVSPDDVKIELEQNTLTISGERSSSRESEHEGYHRVERAYGSFSRSLTLPEGVDAEGVTAKFDNGVLEVQVPKPAQPQARRIEISGGARGAIEGSESAPADEQ